MTNGNTVVQKALEMYVNRDRYCYFYGAKGQVLTDARMEALWKAEPAYFKKYTAEQKKAIFDYSRGKIGYDCSGFVCKVLTDAGAPMNTYSTAIYENCPVKFDSISPVPEGGYLYFSSPQGGRHAAIDIGHGYTLAMNSEMKTIELFHNSHYNSFPQRRGGLFKGVEYSDCSNR